MVDTTAPPPTIAPSIPAPVAPTSMNSPVTSSSIPPTTVASQQNEVPASSSPTNPTQVPSTTVVATVCKQDVKQCKNQASGEVFEFGRDPKNYCSFPACPAGTTLLDSSVATPPSSVIPTTTNSVAQSSTSAPNTESAAPSVSTLPTTSLAAPTTAKPEITSPTPATVNTSVQSITAAPTITTLPPQSTSAPTASALPTSTAVPSTTAPTVHPSTPAPGTTFTTTIAATTSLSPTTTVTPTATVVTSAPTTTVAPTTTPITLAPTTTVTPSTTATKSVPTTNAPSPVSDEAQWVGIDDNRPETLVKASHDAFNTYNSPDICDSFKVDLVSFEKMTGIIPKSGQMYSVVARVQCSTSSDEAGGKYILHFDELPVDNFHLTMCGHVKNAIVTNWIGIDNGTAICQNSIQKTDFSKQKVEHVEHTSAISEYYKRLESGDPVGIAVAIGAVVVLGLFITGLVVLRNRFRYHKTDSATSTPNNKVGEDDDDESKEEEDDEDIELAMKKKDDEVVLDEPDTTTNLKSSMKLDTPGVNEKARFTID